MKTHPQFEHSPSNFCVVSVCLQPESIRTHALTCSAQCQNHHSLSEAGFAAAEEDHVNTLFGTPQSVSSQTFPQKGASTDAATDTPFASGKLPAHSVLVAS